MSLDSESQSKSESEIGILRQKVSQLESALADCADMKNVLVEKEKLLASVFKVTEVGICITNERGTFEDVNNAYCEIYGYDKSELIGKPFTLVVPDENKKEAQNLHDEFIAGEEEIPMEWIVQRKDGTLINIYVTAGRLTDDKGNRFKVTTVTDVTAKKKAEEIINRFGRILEKSYNEIYIFEISTLRIIQANQGALHNLDYNLQELTELTAIDLMPNLDKKSFEERVSPPRNEEDELAVFETELRRKNATLYSAEVRLQLMHHENPPVFVAIIQDITEQKKLIRIEEELRVAHDIQAKLLPASPPSLDGYDIYGISIPAREVGGDYYDFITIDEDHIACCLGDVSGKGMPAALLMSNLQAIIRGQSMLNLGTSECLRRSNRLLYFNTTADKFATFFYALLDTREHRIYYSSAGHNFPLLFLEGGEPQRLEIGGIILGWMEEFTYDEGCVFLKPGDLLLIYSDGITEALNVNEEEYEEERLTALVKNHLHRSSEEIARLIINEVNLFMGDADQYDDMTLLLIKRKS